MKKFPEVKIQKGKEVQLAALYLVVASMRRQDMVWTEIERLYKKSPYSKVISWSKLYNYSSKTEKSRSKPKSTRAKAA